MSLRQPIFPLACILVCATLPTRAATPQTCPDGDSDCFERNQVAACHEPSTSTTETCRAWIHLLEQQASKGSSHAELRLADANRAIADLVTDPRPGPDTRAARAQSTSNESVATAMTQSR